MNACYYNIFNKHIHLQKKIKLTSSKTKNKTYTMWSEFSNEYIPHKLLYINYFEY